MNNSNNASGRFLRDVRPGYKVTLPMILGDATLTVRDIEDNAVTLLPEGAEWDAQPYVLDADIIHIYRIIAMDERKAPLQDEIDAIIAEVETEHAVELGSLKLFKALAEAERPSDRTLTQTIQGAWDATSKAKDDNAFDNNVRKCNRQLLETGYKDSRTLYALRGYIEYRWYYTLPTKSEAGERKKKAQEDFTKAGYARGLYAFLDDNTGTEGTEYLSRILRDETELNLELDMAVLHEYLRRVSPAVGAPLVRSLVERVGLNEDLLKVALYVVNKSVRTYVQLPDESGLFSDANIAFITDKLAAIEPEQSVALHADVSEDIEDNNEKTDTGDGDKARYPHEGSYYGYISDYTAKGFFGHIRLDEADAFFVDESDLFFHVNNVMDDELRRRLIGNQFKPMVYRISFKLYHNTAADDDICAGDIEWVNADEVKCGEQSDPNALVSGEITSYSEYDNWRQRVQLGYVRINGEDYGFALRNVDDPILREYLSTYWMPNDAGIKVYCVMQGKRVEHICRAEEHLPNNGEYDVRNAMSDEEYEAWLKPRQPEPTANVVAEVQLTQEQEYILNKGYTQLYMLWTEPLPKWTKRGPRTAKSNPTGITGITPTKIAIPSDTKFDPEKYMGGRLKSKIERFESLLQQAGSTENSCPELFAEANPMVAAKDAPVESVLLAISIYERIIREGSIYAATRAVSQMLQAYMRIKYADESIALLKAVRKCREHGIYLMPNDDYTKRLIMALEATHDSDYWDELVELYLIRTRDMPSDSKKTHLLFGASRLRFLQGRYEECLDLLREWEQTVYEYQRTTPGVDSHVLLGGFMLRAESWVFLDNNSEAARVARQVLDIDPTNEIGLSIANGISKEALSTMVGVQSQKSDDTPQAQSTIANDDIHTAAQPTHEAQNAVDEEPEYRDEDIPLPAYAYDRLNEVRLTSQARLIGVENLDADGNFTGDMTRAHDVVERIWNRLPRGIEERRNVLFAIARVLESVDVPMETLERYYQGGYKGFVGRGLVAEADANALNGRIDNAVYIYSIALRSNSRLEQALYRSIALQLTDSSLVSDAINSNPSSREDSESQSALSSMRYLADVRLDDAVMNRFVLEALLQNKDLPNLYLQMGIVRKLFNNMDARQLIYEYLCEITGEKPSKNTTTLNQDKFTSLWNRAAGQIYTDYGLMEGKITELVISTELSDMAVIADDIRGLPMYKRMQQLGGSDFNRLNGFLNLVGQWTNYVRDRDESSFAARENALGAILNECKSKLPEWEKAPLRVSYELLLSKMRTLLRLAEREQQNLFSNNPARLTVELGTQNVVRDGNLISVQLCVRSEPNTMDAENIKLELVEGGDCTLLPDRSDTELRYLASGSSTYMMITLYAEDRLLDQDNIVINISANYRDAAQNLRDAQTRTLEPAMILIPLTDRSAFKRIDNPYDPDKNSCAPSMFFGRENDISNVLENMSMPGDPASMIDGKGVVIYGQKRAGKTSIKDHLKDRVKQRFSDKQRLMIIDIDSLGLCRVEDKGISFKSMFTQIINNMVDCLYAEYDELGDEFIESIEDFSLQMVGADTETAQNIFMNCLATVRRRFMRDEPDQPPMRMVLIIDEFTYLYEDMLLGYLDSSCITFFKALIENYKMMIIVVAQDSYESFSNYKDCANALAVFRRVRVTYLEENAVRQLIERPTTREDGSSRFDEESVNEIWRLTAGSAYYVQMICRALIEYMNERRFETVNRGTLDLFLRERFYPVTLNRDKFDPLYRDLQDRVSDPQRPRDNFNLLRQIAQLSAKTRGASEYVRIDELDLSRLHMERERVLRLIQILIERDVLIPDENNRVRIKVSLMREWFLRSNVGEYREE